MAPKRWTVILNSAGSSDVSPSSHQSKRRRSRWCSETRTKWNMASMSHMTAIGSFLNLQRTPVKLLVRSGPCNRLLFSVSPLNSAEQSKTHGFVWFLGMIHSMMWDVPNLLVSKLAGVRCSSFFLLRTILGRNFLCVAILDYVTHKGSVVVSILLISSESFFQLVQTTYSDFAVVRQACA